MSNTLTLARDRANAFARLHLPECAAELLSWKETSPVAFMFRGADGRLRMDACRHKPNEAGWEGVFGEPRPAPTPLPTI